MQYFRAKVEMFESILDPTMLCGCRILGRGRVNVTKVKCLSSICDAKRIDKARSVMIRGKCGYKLSLFEKADWGVGLVKCFGHLERRNDEK